MHASSNYVVKFYVFTIYQFSHTNNILNGKTFLVFNSIQRETFEGENFHKFQGFVAIHKSFLYKSWSFDGMSKQSVKVFSTKVVFSTNLRKLSAIRFNKPSLLCKACY